MTRALTIRVGDNTRIRSHVNYDPETFVKSTSWICLKMQYPEFQWMTIVFSMMVIDLIPYFGQNQWPEAVEIPTSTTIPNDSQHQQGAKGRCCAVAALQRALQGLQDVPPYGLREVLAWSLRGRLIKNGVVLYCLFQRDGSKL